MPETKKPIKKPPVSKPQKCKYCNCVKKSIKGGQSGGCGCAAIVK